MPGTDTITIYRGEDTILPFTMTPPEDITGWELTFTIHGGNTRVITTATPVDPTAGTMTVVLPPEATAVLSPGTYDYDLWRSDIGAERVIAIGNLVVSGVARDVSAL